MNQEKIGSFIASCRKENGFTQAALAEKLGITDRAISKWENGKSLPDPSIMLELCELLHINVNELLTGERLDMENYKEMAEKNLMVLARQEELNNKKTAGAGKCNRIYMLGSISCSDICSQFCRDDTNMADCHDPGRQRNLCYWNVSLHQARA